MALSRDLNAGMRCVKYMLFLFNLLFSMTGVLIITVGVSINAIYKDYIAFLDHRFFPPTTLLVVTGFIIFVVAFFGCFGAIRESTCMIMLFSVLLGVIFILEFSAGIAAYMLHDGLTDMLYDRLHSLMLDYDDNPHAKDTIDFMQQELQCCGMTSASDWNRPVMIQSLYVNIPESCFPSGSQDPFPAGCLNHLRFLVGQSALLLATAAMSIAMLQLLGVMFGCSLARSIRIQKTERIRRQQELREQLINSYAFVGPNDPKKVFPPVIVDPSNNSSNA